MEWVHLKAKDKIVVKEVVWADTNFETRVLLTDMHTNNNY